MELINFVRPLFAFLLFYLIHDVVIKKIYCKWKHKYNQTKYKCYYWNCKHFHDCSMNVSDEMRITNFIKSIFIR